MDCTLLGSSVHGISQVRTLEYIVISSSRGSSWPRGGTHVSCVSCIGSWFFTTSTTWEASATTWNLIIHSLLQWLQETEAPHKCWNKMKFIIFKNLLMNLKDSRITIRNCSHIPPLKKISLLSSAHLPLSTLMGDRIPCSTCESFMTPWIFHLATSMSPLCRFMSHCKSMVNLMSQSRFSSKRI